MTNIWCIDPEILSATERIFCHSELFFALLSPYRPRKSQFWKNEKNIWKYYHLTNVYHKWQSHDVWFLRYGVQWTEFLCHFGPFFASLLNHVLAMLACSGALHVYMLACPCGWRACVLLSLVCLCASVLMCFHAWHAYLLSCLACLLAWLAYVFGMLTFLVCLHACVLAMMKCFIFLCVCVLGMLFCLTCFTFQYLNLKILTVKNLCALLSWTYFLFTFWYQLIKLFETNLREAGKSIDISYSCSCSKAI